MTERERAILVLEDGTSFSGTSFGATGTTSAEIVFNTGMTGYQETLTDPSYRGQIVVMTAPHIGNTGANAEDFESKQVWVSGYVVRDRARIPSNWRADRSLDDLLQAEGVIGIADVDTRALTRHLRELGSMRAVISTEIFDVAQLQQQATQTASMAGSNFLEDVTTPEKYVVPALGDRVLTVAAIDLGIKSMTPRRFSERGVETHVFPATATVEDILAIEPDGVFMSNGPGDPATADHAVGVLQAVLERGLPYFGICLGNQIFGRALGLGTYKLKYGHRGINQPVQDRTTGKVEVTAHNHGFAVDAPLDRDFDTPFGAGRVTHVCLNDNVVEGIALTDWPAFSVQYHPEAAAGPHDADYLFDRFIELMSTHNSTTVSA